MKKCFDEDSVNSVNMDNVLLCINEAYNASQVDHPKSTFASLTFT
jgi:hypothetical protein